MKNETVDGEEGYTPLNFENFYGQELKTEDEEKFLDPDFGAHFDEIDTLGDLPDFSGFHQVGDLPDMETTLTMSPHVNRFHLEDDILRCWNLSEELGVLNEAVLNGDISKDDISNILVGLQKLYNLKFEKMWGTFEALIKNGDL